jgi:hypothetical protein
MLVKLTPGGSMGPCFALQLLFGEKISELPGTQQRLKHRFGILENFRQILLLGSYFSDIYFWFS